jgi:hypothetical protein
MTLGNNPEAFIQNDNHGESLQSHIPPSMFTNEMYQLKRLVFVVSVYLAFEKISQRNLSQFLSSKTIYFWLYNNKYIHCTILGKSAMCSDSNYVYKTDNCVTLHISLT